MSSAARSRNNGRRSSRRGNETTRLLTNMTKSLKSLEISQTQEVNGILPGVPDPIPIMIKPGKVYSFWKSVDKGTLTTSTTLATAVAYVFRLSDSTDSAGLVGVFDKFRIAQVQISFIPNAIGSNSTSQPPLSTSIDNDDANSPSSLSTLLESPTFSSTEVGKVHTRTLVPRAVNPVYNGAFSAYAQMPLEGWVDTTYSNTDWYGLKLYMGTTSVVQSYTVIARYLLQFADPN